MNSRMSLKGRRWRRVAAVVAGWVALRLVVVVVFRRRNRPALGAIRRFNRRWLNPVMLRFAGGPHWYAARLEHVGRRSGRMYMTPVVAKPIRDGFAVPLPYGVDVDWLRNVEAAGQAWLDVRGECYLVRDPRVVPTAEIAAQLPPQYRYVSRLHGITEWLVLTSGGVDGAAARPEPAPGGRSRHDG